MSAFSSLLSSIDGAGQRNTSAQKPNPAALKPIITNGPFKVQSKSAPTTPAADPSSRPIYKGTAGLSSGSQQNNSLKRKADESIAERPVKMPRPMLVSHNSDRVGQKAKPQSGDSRTVAPLKSRNGTSTSQSAPAPVKAPSKGSYAEMMARAKEAAQTKTPSQVGVIKHQATDKIKGSKSAAERRKAEQEKIKTNTTSNVNGNGKPDPRYRSKSPVKLAKKGEASAPRLTKVPQPPLHAPARPQGPSYKGTLGQGNKRAREVDQRKKSRNDEYLGTDEEDEDGYGSYGDDEPGGYSDASSDMEGGFDDLEVEERRTLRAAKEDDARELALENKLKREKLERQKKLAAMAASAAKKR